MYLEIERRDEIKFIELGVDRDHVRFLVHSVPTYSVTKIVKLLKSLTAREIFKRCPQVASCIYHAGSHNCNVGRKDATPAGRICHTGCYAANVGDRIDDMSQFIVSVSRLTGKSLQGLSLLTGNCVYQNRRSR